MCLELAAEVRRAERRQQLAHSTCLRCHSGGASGEACSRAAHMLPHPAVRVEIQTQSHAGHVAPLGARITQAWIDRITAALRNYLLYSTSRAASETGRFAAPGNRLCQQQYHIMAFVCMVVQAQCCARTANARSCTRGWALRAAWAC